MRASAMLSLSGTVALYNIAFMLTVIAMHAEIFKGTYNSLKTLSVYIFMDPCSYSYKCSMVNYLYILSWSDSASCSATVSRLPHSKFCITYFMTLP